MVFTVLVRGSVLCLEMVVMVLHVEVSEWLDSFSGSGEEVHFFFGFSS
jgi:hypothetical protein